MSTLKEFVTSKKALVLVASIATRLLAAKLGMSEEEATQVVYLAIAYLIGQGVADIGKEKKA